MAMGGARTHCNTCKACAGHCNTLQQSVTHCNRRHVMAVGGVIPGAASAGVASFCATYTQPHTHTHTNR